MAQQKKDPGTFIPEIWSDKILEDYLQVKQPVLRIGAARITSLDIDRAIADPSFDPILRDAFVAFRTKRKLTG